MLTVPKCISRSYFEKNQELYPAHAIANFPWPWFQVLVQVAMWLAVALTIYSLIDYIYQNRGVLAERKEEE